MLNAFDAGSVDAFGALWEKHIPLSSRKNTEGRAMIFYVNLHFAIFPLAQQTTRSMVGVFTFAFSQMFVDSFHTCRQRAGKGVVRGAAESQPYRSAVRDAMDRFSRFLLAEGGEMRDKEFVPYLALPNVSDPRTHPAFQHLFSLNKHFDGGSNVTTDSGENSIHRYSWSQNLRDRLKRFLLLTFQTMPSPRSVRALSWEEEKWKHSSA